MIKKLERMIRSIVSRAIVNSRASDGLYQVLWLDDRVSADVEHLQTQGVHFRAPADAVGALLSPSGNQSASVLLCAGGAEPTDAVAAGEGGLHYLGAFKVFLRADGTLALGSYNPTDGVGVDSLIEARFSELKLAVQASFAALTPLPAAPVDAATLLDDTLTLANSLWPSPTGSATVKVEP